jgi:hypothetical protein
MADVFPSVVGLIDGQDEINADSLNRPINQLTRRTDFLRNQLDQLIGTGAFESVRLTDVDLDDTDTPAVNDFVYLNPDTNKYTKALADVLPSVFDAYAGATASSYALAMVTSVSGTKGNLATFGKIDLATITLADLLEPGEVFRAGPYFLSTSSAGKMTAVPKGPDVFLGIFLDNKDNPVVGDFGFLSPQLKDVLQAHLHNNYAMHSQPAGENITTGVTPTDTHTIRGFQPDTTVTAGTPARAFILGAWTGEGTTEYTLRIDAADDTLGTARLYWETNDGSDDSATGFDRQFLPGGAPDPSYDPDYGATVGVRISSYETPVSFGSKGLFFVLERDGAVSDYDTVDFDEYLQTGTAVGERTWTIDAPTQIQGWLPKWQRLVSTYTGTTTDPEYLLHLFGRFVNPDGRVTDTIKVSVVSAGDFALDNVDLEVRDKDDSLIIALNSVGFSGQGYNVINAGDWDLWLLVSPYEVDHTAAGTTTAALTDAWEFSLIDEAPNAALEYNIDMDFNLRTYYPPKPLTSVTSELNGLTLDKRDFFRDASGTYTPGVRTLFWYPELYGKVPFPRDWVSVASPGSTEYQQNMSLYLAHMAMAEAGIVTSLTANSESGVSIKDAVTGESSSTGDLELAFDLSLATQDTGATGADVIKEVSGNQLLTGKVVEKIIPGPGIVATPADPNFPGQGTVTLSVSGGQGGDYFRDVTYENAKKDLVPGKLFSFTKLLAFDSTSSGNVPSSFLAQFRVPQTLTGRYRIIVYFVVFGLDDLATGVAPQDTQYAGLDLTYSVLPDLTKVGEPNFPGFDYVNDSFLLDASETTLSLINDVPFGSDTEGYKAYDPILLHNDPNIAEIPGQVTAPFGSLFPTAADTPPEVTAGNMVAIRVKRVIPQLAHQGGTVEYTGEIGFIDLRWQLVEI